VVERIYNATRVYNRNLFLLPFFAVVVVVVDVLFMAQHFSTIKSEGTFCKFIYKLLLCDALEMMKSFFNVFLLGRYRLKSSKLLEVLLSVGVVNF
jgi:hypothetical protein